MIPSISQFTGTWVGRRTDCFAEDFVCRILPDGRYIAIITDIHRIMGTVKRRHYRMPFWLGIASDTMIFFRLHLKKPAHPWHYHFEGEHLIFRSGSGLPSPRWECSRLTAEETPAWFEHHYAIALNRPWR